MEYEYGAQRPEQELTQLQQSQFQVRSGQAQSQEIKIMTRLGVDRVKPKEWFKVDCSTMFISI